MEAVAAVSSVGGIVSIAGQVLSGIRKLREFFKDYGSASKSIDRFLRDLNSLIQTLEDVKDVVLKLENVSTFGAKTVLSSLQIQLEDCSKNVYDWVRVGAEHRPQSVSGSKAVFKKFLVAVNKECMTDIFKDIESHKDNIGLKLSLIGRSLDIDHATNLQSIRSKLDDVSNATAASNKITFDALQRLEEQASIDRAEAPGTPSLQSLVSALSSQASVLSRIENMISSQQGSLRSGRSVGSSIGSRRQYSPATRRSPALSMASNASSGGSAKDSKWNRRGSILTFTERSSAHDTREHFVMSQGSANGPYCQTTEIGGDGKTLSAIQIAVNGAAKRIFGDPLRPSNMVDEYSPTPSTHHPLPPPTSSKDSRSEREPKSEKENTHSLLKSYNGLLKICRGNCPDALFAYFRLVSYFRVVSLHASLLASIQITGEGGPPLIESKEYRDVQEHLDLLRKDIEIAKTECWAKGYDLAEIDPILEPGNIGGQTHRHEYTEEMKSHADLLALRKRLLYLKAQHAAWSSSQDRVNAWLLQNLAASREEVALHRSFLPDSVSLSEKQWARLVLKFWPLDGAAFEVEGQTLSTNSALNSGKGKNTIRVFLEMAERDWEDRINSATESSDVAEQHTKKQTFEPGHSTQAVE